VAKFVITVNGRLRTIESADPDMPLLWVLRDRFRLTGTKFGCGVGVCGACTVHMDGEAVRSCQVPVSAAARHRVTTIEGLSPEGRHPCQRAWLEEDVAQCGYCQPGMIMAAAALLARRRPTDEKEIEASLSEHVCRCGTYTRIRRALRRAMAGREGR
jgi:aerobic-type carbon monoxide dehydrogenase small subunit (CoxS/CutS family)